MSVTTLKENDLLKKLPYKQITDDGLILLLNCDLARCYEVILPEIFSLSTDQITAVHQGWVKAINGLPNHWTVVQQDWFTYHSHHEEVQPSDSALEQANKKFFNGRQFPLHRCYLYLTRHASAKQVKILESSFLRTNLVDKESNSFKAIEEFNSSCERFADDLRMTERMAVHPIDGDALRGVGEKRGLIEQYLTLDTHPDHCKHIDIDASEPNNIVVGDRYMKMFAIQDMDEFANEVSPYKKFSAFSTERADFNVGAMATLGMLLESDHICTQYIRTMDSKQEQVRLEKIQNQMTAFAKYSRKNDLLAQKIGSYLNEYVEGGTERRIVTAHANILLWDDDKLRLKVKANEALTRIKQLGFVPKVETVNTMLLYMSNLPGNSAELPKESCVQLFTHQAACLMNYESSYRSDPQGVMFTDRINGQPIRVDLSDVPMEKKWVNNRNKFVLGGSGSGKSFLTNGLMRHYAEGNSDIVILDMGDSYRGLCDFFGGIYLKYTDETPIAFNPFKLPNNERYPVRDKIDALVALLFSLWGKEEDGKISKDQFRLESLTLGESIELYYKWINEPENAHIEVKFDTYYEFLGNQFRAHLKAQNFTDKDFNLRTLLLILKHFYKGGQYDFLLNSDIDHTLFEEKFIVFEIDAIKNNPVLYPVVTIIVMEVFISKMLKKKGIRKIMLIEEAWKALSEKKMATFIEYLYRTCRKYYGETWTVTQNPDDILESEFAKKTIVNNADTKLILDLLKFENNLKEIMGMLNFTEHQASQVLSLNPGDELKSSIKRKYKEVYVSYLKYSNVYAFEVSPNEYFTYTTEELEKNTVHEIAAMNDCSTAHAIERIIDQYQGDYKKAYQNEVLSLKSNPLVDTLEKLVETGMDYNEAFCLLRDAYKFNYKRALQEIYNPYVRASQYQQAQVV